MRKTNPFFYLELQWLRSGLQDQSNLCTPPRPAALGPAGRRPEILLHRRDYSAPLKTSLYTVVRRGSTAIVHCLLPRFYRGCPRFCYSGLDRSSPVFIRDFSFPAPTGLLPLLRDFSRYCGASPATAGHLHVVRRHRGVASTSVVVSCGERTVRFEHRDSSFPSGFVRSPTNPLLFSSRVASNPGQLILRLGLCFPRGPQISKSSL